MNFRSAAVVAFAAALVYLFAFSEDAATFPLTNMFRAPGFTFDAIPSMAGKTVLVTGANSGYVAFEKKQLLFSFVPTQDG